MGDQARSFKCDFELENRFLVIFHDFGWIWRLSEGEGKGREKAVFLDDFVIFCGSERILRQPGGINR